MELLKLSRKENKEVTRQKIIDSARALIIKEGLQGFSMNKIAQGAGIAQPSFYRHFNNLEGLLLALKVDIRNTYLSPLQSAISHLVPTVPAEMESKQMSSMMQHGIGLVFDALLQNIELYRFVIQDQYQTHQPLGGYLGSLMDDFRDEWVEFLYQFSSKTNKPQKKHHIKLYIQCTQSLFSTLVFAHAKREYTKAECVDVITQLLLSSFNSE